MDDDHIRETLAISFGYKTSSKQDDYRRFKINNKKIELNDEQYNVVSNDIKDHLRIIACAGSGKTTTIVCRIKYLIDHGIDARDIMLTTFNVDAAESMKRKIESVFGFMPKIMVGTLDSIACRFYFGYFKKEGYVGVSEYATELLKFLRGRDGKKITGKFRYLFFDEFQDCNDIQFDIVQEFYKAGCIITVIGDDAQNIYQWRGSNIEYILRFDNYVKNVKTLKLVHNYRSTPEIVAFANASISNNTDQIPKQMIATNPSISIKPKIVPMKNEEYQAKKIVRRIIECLNSGIPEHEIAIIARNNYSIKNIEEEIEKWNSNPDNMQIKYIALITDDLKDGKPKIMMGHVTLTTIHKSKGLEWDVVLMISCNDDKFPAEVDSIAIQEERRLFYVAVTRAKRYLEIYFTNNSVSRFVGEVDDKCYNFVNFKIEYMQSSNMRNLRFKTGITQMIELLDSKDIEILRMKDILPNIIPNITKIHSEHKIDESVSTYYLHSDYGIYIDRYISHRFGIENPNSKGLIDSVAERVIKALILETYEYPVYLRYNTNIIKKLTPNMYNHGYDLIMNYIDKTMNDPEYIRVIESVDKKILRCVIKKIVNLGREFNIMVSQLFVVPKSFLPREFIIDMNASYMTYRKGVATEKNIYKVSLCQNVYDGRRRLLYKDVFDAFNSDKTLYNDIDTWVKSFSDKNIIIKKTLHDSELSLDGELDMIDITDNTIIDFKCSTSTDCKLEWFIQLLSYTALVRRKTKLNINTVKIYNPIAGLIISFDVKDWNKETELLKYLDETRTTRLLRTVNAEQRANKMKSNKDLKTGVYNKSILDWIN